MRKSEEKSTEERTYTYWLADADIIVTKKGGEEIENSLLLSRAFIFDTELQKKSDTDRLLKKLEDIDLSRGCGDDILVEQPNFSPEEMALWAELPKQFGEPKTSPRKRPYRSKNFENANTGAIHWLNNADFDEYWQYTSQYIIYYTWLKLIEDQLDDVKKVEMEESVLATKPKPNYVPIIEPFEESNLNANYVDLVKKHDDYNNFASDYNKLYEVHCELVKKQAEQEFDIFKRKSTRNRCKEFFNKIETMGFSSGVTEEDIKKDAKCVASGLNWKTDEVANNSQDEPMQQEEPPKKKSSRFPVVYGEDEVFSDIYYDVYDKLGGRGKNLLGARHNKAKAVDSKESGYDSFVESSNSEGIDIKNVTFNFDPEAEGHLLASNAHNYYKNDPEIRKYFYQRYRLFSKLDDGVIMDREGWFSVTPEKIASHIADRIVTTPGMIVVDAFAGVGGNSIQFALKGARVIAIDLDPTRLKCAYQNAKVYGVADKIEFICCDFFHFAAKWAENVNRREQIDVVFLSPPWGGPSYMDKKEFLLDEGLTPDGFDIFTASRAMSPNIAYFLPKNTSVKQLRSLLDPGGRLEIEQSCLNKKIKLITAYYGNLAYQRK